MAILTNRELNAVAHELADDLAQFLDRRTFILRRAQLVKHCPELRPWLSVSRRVINQLSELEITEDGDEDDDE